uniref:Protein FAM98A n=2 Tax=Toxoplasma gondii TaxID=5811 RepID=A0A2G8XSL8_TOXGO|nr:hypothetical protein TGCOUG_293230 [Toxoplasma gondii COUG]
MDSLRPPVGVDELQSSLVACYERINGRRTSEYSQQEVLLLLQDCCYFSVVEQILREVALLEGGCVDDFDAKDFIAFVRSRGYRLPELLTREALADFALKRILLYNLLADLQSCRLVAKKRLSAALSVPSAANFGSVCTPEAEAAEQAHASLEAIKTICGSVGLSTDFSSLHEAVQKGHFAQAARKIAEGPVPASAHALVPALPVNDADRSSLLKNLELITHVLEKEYLLRRRAMLRRLDVTVQAFLWSKRAADHEAAIAALLQGMMTWREKHLNKNVNLFDVFAVEKDLLTARLSRPVSSAEPAKPVLSIKTLIIGPVPDRGGIPDGYSMQQVQSDVRRANEWMRHKDGDRSDHRGDLRRGGAHWGRRSEAPARTVASANSTFSAARTSASSSASAFSSSPHRPPVAERGLPEHAERRHAFRTSQSRPSGTSSRAARRGAGGGFGGRAADRPATWNAAL